MTIGGLGEVQLLSSQETKKKRKEEKEVKEEKINKNGWDAASELQLKNRLEKKIKEIEREKKLKKEN